MILGTHSEKKVIYVTWISLNWPFVGNFQMVIDYWLVIITDFIKFVFRDSDLSEPYIYDIFFFFLEKKNIHIPSKDTQT